MGSTSRQVLLTSRPNPAGQFLGVFNPCGAVSGRFLTLRGSFWTFLTLRGSFQTFSKKKFFFFCSKSSETSRNCPAGLGRQVRTTWREVEGQVRIHYRTRKKKIGKKKNIYFRKIF